MGDFEKNFLQALVGKKKVACSTNVTESLWEKKGKKYPAHQIAKKKILDDQKYFSIVLGYINYHMSIYVV